MSVEIAEVAGADAPRALVWLVGEGRTGCFRLRQYSVDPDLLATSWPMLNFPGLRRF
jgi:hypothetical protein